MQSGAGLHNSAISGFFVQYHPKSDEVVTGAKVGMLGQSELCQQLLCKVIVEGSDELYCGLDLTGKQTVGV